MRQPKKTRHRGDHAMKRATSLADLIADFSDLLPSLQSAIRLGLSAEEIYAEYSALVAARGVQVALTEADSGKAITAIRDILDRTQGKAKERQDVTHRLEKLPEEQLDAVLLTKIQDLKSKTQKVN